MKRASALLIRATDRYRWAYPFLLPFHEDKVAEWGQWEAKVARRVDDIGKSLIDPKYREHLELQARAEPFEGKSPRLEGPRCVASNAFLLGDVTMKKGSTVWFSAVVRGDVHPVSIGVGCHVLDRVHISTDAGPVTIGDEVILEAGAVVQSCTIESDVYVAPNAVLGEGCVIKQGCCVGPGAVVQPGQVLEVGRYYSGAPAQDDHEMTEGEMVWIRRRWLSLADLAGLYAYELAAPAYERNANEQLKHTELRFLYEKENLDRKLPRYGQNPAEEL